MTLDTYLPVGHGRYFIGSEPGSPDRFYYFMPERREHVRVCFRVIGRDQYGEAQYSDVIVHSLGGAHDRMEEGEYHIFAPLRGCRLVELSSGGEVKRFLALGQPRLGRFRFIDC